MHYFDIILLSDVILAFGPKVTHYMFQIMTQDDCNNAVFNRFCNNNIDVSNFLNIQSLLDHNNFCLAYVFTYRDFSGGTLGLAWVGSAGGMKKP